jgi:hypothetical protein
VSEEERIMRKGKEGKTKADFEIIIILNNTLYYIALPP